MADDLIYEMRRLIVHAFETDQRPTEFVLGSDAFSMLRIACPYQMSVPTGRPEPFRVFDVAVRRDVRLPRCRVVLKAGRNTVGAFSVTMPDRTTLRQDEGGGG